MLAQCEMCKAPPVGVLLGGTGVYRNASQSVPQVSVLLSSSRYWQQCARAEPAIAATFCAEADHVD